jgi:hypothetical protein
MQVKDSKSSRVLVDGFSFVISHMCLVDCFISCYYNKKMFFKMFFILKLYFILKKLYSLTLLEFSYIYIYMNYAGKRLKSRETWDLNPIK